jgi:hypothetical protein
VPSDYRLSPPLAARLLGVGLAGVGILVCLATIVTAVLHLPLGALTLVVVLAMTAILICGALLTRRRYVVRLAEEGYQVRFVRGAGVRQARWGDVDDAVTADVAGAPCVVLRLKDGRTTSIPVEVLAVERDAFVRDVQSHLTRFGIDRLGR